MNFQLELFRLTRQNLNAQLEGLPLEQVNATPSGFQNNILWNVGHILFAQQVLLNMPSGVPLDIPDEVFQKFVSGTKPGQPATETEWMELRSHLQENTRRFFENWQQQRFAAYNPFHGTYGIASYILNNPEEALQYNNLHEAVHLGYIMAIRKALGVKGVA